MKKGMKITLILIPILLLIGGAAFLYFGTSLFLSPKAKVMLAFSRTFSENSVIAVLSENEKYAGEDSFLTQYFTDLNFSDIKELFYSEEPISYESSITLENLELTDVDANLSMLSGTGLIFKGETDLSDKQLYQYIGIQYAGFPLISGNFYLDDTDLSIEVPDLYDGYLTLNTESLGTDYNSSVLCEITDYPIPEESVNSISFNYFKIAGSDSSLSQYMDESSPYWEDYTEIMKALHDAIEVESTGKRLSFTIGEEEEKCSEYIVSISEDDIHQFIESLMNLNYDILLTDLESNENLLHYYQQLFILSEETSPEDLVEFMESESSFIYDYIEDIEFFVYLDSSCRLISIQADEFSIEDMIRFEDIELIWSGEEYLFDDFTANMTITEAGSENEYNLTLSNYGESNSDSRTDNLSFSLENQDTTFYAHNLTTTYTYEEQCFTLDGHGETKDFTIDHALEMQFSYDEDSSSFSIELENLSFGVQDIDSTLNIAVSGDYEIAPTEEVSTPSGTEYHLFEMSETELFSLALEIADNIESSPIMDLMGL